jgi:hypothetical protein
LPPGFILGFLVKEPFEPFETNLVRGPAIRRRRKPGVMFVRVEVLDLRVLDGAGGAVIDQERR